MPVRKSVQQAGQNWSAGMAQAGNKYTQGIQAVTQAPGQAAAANVNGYLQGVADNARKWQTKVAAVDLGTWQQAAINKGAPRLATGAQQAQPKYEAGLQRWWPVFTNIVAQVDAMPKATKADRINRMVQYATLAGQYQGG